jgi:hypothetical protein
MPVLGTNPHAQTSNNYQGFLLVENSQVYDIPIIIFIHADGFFSYEDFHRFVSAHYHRTLPPDKTNNTIW